MKKIAWLPLLVLLGCDPRVENTPAVPVVTARFDPSASPAVVPSPNDLATDPRTGRLAVPIAANASGADQAFLRYLNQLDGFPAGVSASATFDGKLKPDSVKQGAVRVFDLSDNFRDVLTTFNYVDLDGDEAQGQVTVLAPAGGWQPGHRYGVALVGGADGLQSVDGRPVVGTATWRLIRSPKSLVTCSDLHSPDCRTATELIPSDEKGDAARRLADQTAKALRLETLRLKYQPALDFLATRQVAREDVVLLWSFQIAGLAQVVFNPSAQPARVPTPTDLARSPVTGLLTLPVDPASSPANQEFITDYLNTLDGFPVSTAAVAEVVGGALDPTSVTADTVKVLTLKGDEVTGATPAWDAARNAVVVSPPAGGWGKGRQVAIAVVGGAGGVKQLGGGPVVGSEIWALVRSAAPLVDCAELSAPTCARLITAAPLTTAQALQLEALRRGYAPVLAALEAQGIARDDVAVLWVFSTVSRPEATFDPANGVVPFPTDLLRTGVAGRLSLPVPPNAPPTLAALLGGLNTLDGFSLTAHAVSENADGRGVIDGTLDEASLDGGVGFRQLTGLSLPPADVRVCLNCASSPPADGGSAPQQLQFVPQRPLNELSTYGAWLTAQLTDTEGRSVMASTTFALMRLKNPLCEGAENGRCGDAARSLVSGVSDAQARQLEPARAAMQPFIESLATNGVPRSKLALAWSFRTQTTVTALKTMRDATAAGTRWSANPTFLADLSASVLAAATVPKASIGKLYTGNLETPYLLTGTDAMGNPTGTISPNVATWKTTKVPFWLTLPTGAPPATGWPVLLFGHGLSSNRTTMLALADTASRAGYAVLAIDVVLHGERTSCVGIGAALQRGLNGNPPVANATDDFACQNPMTMRCEPTLGRCVARAAGTPCTVDAECAALGLGQCRTDALAPGTCEGGDFARTSASSPPTFASWNFLDLGNLFATRDHFRHAVADFAQLVRVVQATGPGSLSALLGATGALDPTTIHYAGISLGSFNGTLYSSVSPEVKRFALNVVGSDMTEVLLTSPAFSAQRTGFLAQLAGLGLTPGTPGFDNFIVLARTVFDSADPRNAIHDGVNSATVGRQVFVQWIENDFVIPNSTTAKLIAAGSRSKPLTVRSFNPILPGDLSCTGAPAGSLCASQRHSFLLNFADPMLTLQAQQQVVDFVGTGALP